MTRLRACEAHAAHGRSLRLWRGCILPALPGRTLPDSAEACSRQGRDVAGECVKPMLLMANLSGFGQAALPLHEQAEHFQFQQNQAAGRAKS